MLNLVNKFNVTHTLAFTLKQPAVLMSIDNFEGDIEHKVYYVGSLTANSSS